MRDIKFRAWDNILNEYFSWEDSIRFNNYHDLIEDNYDGAVSLEQYTGLKDKNGVEIYENDIVRCSRGCPHKVVWDEERGGMFGGGMTGWYLSGLDDGYAWTNSEEVIGNMHQDSDLLVDDIERMIPDDIGNDIHEFLQERDK